MNLPSLDRNLLYCITKHLTVEDEQNFSSTCRALRSKLFTDLFFRNMPIRLGIPFVSASKTDAEGSMEWKTREELQSDIRATVASILTTWTSVYPSTRLQDIRGNRLRQLLTVQQEMTTNWHASLYNSSFEAPAFLLKELPKFTPEFCSLQDAISCKILSSYPKDLVEDKAAALTTWPQAAAIEDPITKFCFFHIWLFACSSVTSNREGIAYALENMPSYLKSHAVNNAVLTNVFNIVDGLDPVKPKSTREDMIRLMREAFALFLHDSTVNLPTGLKEAIPVLQKHLDKTVLEDLDEEKQEVLIALLQAIHAVSRATIPQAINPMPSAMFPFLGLNPDTYVQDAQRLGSLLQETSQAFDSDLSALPANDAQD